MNELRWILTGFGALLLAVIYAWGRFSREQPPARAGRLDFESGAAGGAAANGPPLLEDPVADSSEYAGRFESSPDYEHQPFGAASESDSAAELDADAVAEASLASDPANRAEPVFSSHENIGFTGGDAAAGRVEPTFSRDFGEAHSAVVQEETARDVPPASTPQPKQPRKIVTLRLAAAPLERYEGERLRTLLQSEALKHGKYGIFHALDNAGNSRFSVASMVEPGTFDMATIDQQHYPGITFFTLLPGATDGVEIFEDMTGCAYRLTQSLGGMLQDERGAPLTQRRYNQLREEVAAFERDLG